MDYHQLLKQQKIQSIVYTPNQNSQPNYNKNQKHVVFDVANRNPRQIVNPTQKPKYHFTYGQGFQLNVQPQQINSINQVNQGIHNTVQNQLRKTPALKQTFSSSPYQQKSRSESKRKKNLKIFPKKFQKLQKSQEKQEQPKSQQNEEIKELKTQISRLREDIKNLSNVNSRSISRQFGEESIYKLEAQRTRRLSELNEFNEKLYNQLAWKLKEISLQEYSLYLDKSNFNKMILDSVCQNQSYQQSKSTYNLNQSKDHENFMDIREFEREYEKKYNSNEKIVESKLQSPNKQLDFVAKDNVLFDNGQIQSPFLLKENNMQDQKFAYNFVQTNPQHAKPASKSQAFTFNKPQRQNYFSKVKPAPYSSKLLIVQASDNQPLFSNQRSQVKDYKKAVSSNRLGRGQQKFQRVKREQRQIGDFNRQIQNKLFRKRLNSEYTNLGKIRQL